MGSCADFLLFTCQNKHTMSSSTHLPVMDLVIEYAIGGTKHFLCRHIVASRKAMCRVCQQSCARSYLKDPRRPAFFAPLWQVIAIMNNGRGGTSYVSPFRIQFDIILNSHMHITSR
jgi:hypothetical protein